MSTEKFISLRKNEGYRVHSVGNENFMTHNGVICADVPRGETREEVWENLGRVLNNTEECHE